MTVYHTWSKELQNHWNSILAHLAVEHPFFTYTWHSTWYQTFGNSHPLTILVEPDKWIASFIMIDDTLQFTGGYDIADYLDILSEEHMKQEVWQTLFDYFKSYPVKKFFFNNIPEDSQSLSFFKKFSSSETHGTVQIQKEDTTPKTSILYDNWDSFLATLPRKNRHEIRRKMRKFERDFPEAIFQKSSNQLKNIESLLMLMKKNEEKNTFLTPTMESFFRTIAVDVPQTAIKTLEYNGLPIASTFEFETPKTTYLYNSGFDEEYFSGAGFYLKAYSVKHALERGASLYNFLQGSERYKYELGGHDSHVYAISVDIP